LYYASRGALVRKWRFEELKSPAGAGLTLMERNKKPGKIPACLYDDNIVKAYF
jgi:hypothetical protein